MSPAPVRGCEQASGGTSRLTHPFKAPIKKPSEEGGETNCVTATKTRTMAGGAAYEREHALLNMWGEKQSPNELPSFGLVGTDIARAYPYL
jgi:hypothetical protein